MIFSVLDKPANAFALISCVTGTNGKRLGVYS
jgi:hypothetical protein